MVDVIAGDFQIGTAPMATTILSVPLRNVVFMQGPFVETCPTRVSRFSPSGSRESCESRFPRTYFAQSVGNVPFVFLFVSLHTSDKGTFSFFSGTHRICSGIYETCGENARRTVHIRKNCGDYVVTFS